MLKLLKRDQINSSTKKEKEVSFWCFRNQRLLGFSQFSGMFRPIAWPPLLGLGPLLGLWLCCFGVVSMHGANWHHHNNWELGECRIWGNASQKEWSNCNPSPPCPLPTSLSATSPQFSTPPGMVTPLLTGQLCHCITALLEKVFLQHPSFCISAVQRWDEAASNLALPRQQ